MKSLSLISFVSTILFSATFSLRSQPTFRDLDFEAATIVPIPGIYNPVDFGAAFPGWTGYVGGVQETFALHNSYFLDSSGFTILNTNSVFPGRIEGNFTALLQAGFSLTTGQPADTALAQTGLVPAGTKSIRFKAEENGNIFTVSLGGQNLSVTAVTTGPNYTLFGADIQSWAGQSAELRFTALAENPHQGDNYLLLDSIQFSTQPIPEPGTITLILCGLFCFIFRFRKMALRWLVSAKR